MSGFLEDLQTAAGHRLVCALAVLDGNDSISRTPDDEDRHALGQVETVAGMDALTSGADHSAQSGEEGATTVSVDERSVATHDLRHVRVGMQTECRQAPSDRLSDSAAQGGGGGDEQF